jgi:hypothetical protein
VCGEGLTIKGSFERSSGPHVRPALQLNEAGEVKAERDKSGGIGGARRNSSGAGGVAWQ